MVWDSGLSFLFFPFFLFCVCGCLLFPTPFVKETILSPGYIICSFVKLELSTYFWALNSIPLIHVCFSANTMLFWLPQVIFPDALPGQEYLLLNVPPTLKTPDNFWTWKHKDCASSHQTQWPSRPRPCPMVEGGTVQGAKSPDSDNRLPSFDSGSATNEANDLGQVAYLTQPWFPHL